MTLGIRITLINRRGNSYRGRRARRQAFYRNQRMLRTLARLVASVDTSAFDAAFVDALELGTGFVRVQSEPLEITHLRPWDVSIDRVIGVGL